MSADHAISIGISCELVSPFAPRKDGFADHAIRIGISCESSPHAPGLIVGFKARCRAGPARMP
jgi:hypothetical protein